MTLVQNSSVTLLDSGKHREDELKVLRGNQATHSRRALNYDQQIIGHLSAKVRDNQEYTAKIYRKSPVFLPKLQTKKGSVNPGESVRDESSLSRNGLSNLNPKIAKTGQNSRVNVDQQHIANIYLKPVTTLQSPLIKFRARQQRSAEKELPCSDNEEETGSTTYPRQITLKKYNKFNTHENSQERLKKLPQPGEQSAKNRHQVLASSSEVSQSRQLADAKNVRNSRELNLPNRMKEKPRVKINS